MNKNALATFSARLIALGYKGSVEQLQTLLLDAKKQTEEDQLLTSWQKYPQLMAVFKHLKKKNMNLLCCGPLGEGGLVGSLSHSNASVFIGRVYFDTDKIRILFYRKEKIVRDLDFTLSNGKLLATRAW